MGLAKNIFFSSVSTFSMVFLFFLLILVGRYLGVDEYGVFTTALSFGMIAEIIVDFGLRDLSLRNVARDLDRTATYLGNFLTWKSMASLVVFTALFAIVHILGYEPQVRSVIYIMIVASLAKSMKYTYRLFLQAHNRFDLDAWIETGEKVLLFGLGLALLALWRSLLIFVLGFCLLRILGVLVILLVLNSKIARIQPMTDFRFSMRLQLKAIPFGLFAVVFVLLYNLNSIMLSRMRDYTEVGLYSAAFRIFEGVNILPTIFFLVMLPRLSKLAVSDTDAHEILSRRVVKYMAVMAFPLVAICFIHADVFIQLFGGGFSDSALTMRILSAGILFAYPTWMLNTILISVDRQKITLLIVIIGLIVNVTMNMVVIPLFGYNGAAASTVMSEIVMFSCLLGYIHVKRFSLGFLKPCSLAFLSALIAFTSLAILPAETLWTKALWAALAAVLYLGLLFLFQVFDDEERSMVGHYRRMVLKRLGFTPVKIRG